MLEAAQKYLSEKERSRATVHIVNKLAPYWGRFRLEDVTQKQMTEYAKTLGHLAQASQARMCRQARTIYLYGCREFGLAPKGIKVPSEGQHRTEFLSRTELAKLLENLNPSALAIATFMVYTGARYCEARLVDVSDLKMMGANMMCRLRHRKGRETVWRERWVPVHPEVEKVIQAHGSASGALWRNTQGERWHKDSACLRAAMVRAAAKVGVVARPHILRHTFGTLLANEGGDLRVLAELMGHASLDQTRTYINAASTENAKLIGRL
ncbi:MAG: tyrosine-type recombinase/integrase [Aeromonas allosaccharophila]